MSNQLIVTATTGSSSWYPTRTTGEAHLYRVTQYYDSWPFENSSRVTTGSAGKRTETFRTLEPVRQRLARADLYARNRHRDRGGWSAFVAVAEQLTDHGWQPLDLDVLPPGPVAGRRRPARTQPSRHGTALAAVGQSPDTLQ